jgi:hypothetical protein
VEVPDQQKDSTLPQKAALLLKPKLPELVRHDEGDTDSGLAAASAAPVLARPRGPRCRHPLPARTRACQASSVVRVPQMGWPGGDAIASAVGQQQATIVPAGFSGRAAQGCELPHIAAAQNMRPLFRQAQREAEGNQMRAWMGIAVVVAIGLIWSVAVMSKLVPVDGSEMRLAGTSRPAE